jgi:hypothetical protein
MVHHTIKGPRRDPGAGALGRLGIAAVAVSLLMALAVPFAGGATPAQASPAWHRSAQVALAHPDGMSAARGAARTWSWYVQHAPRQTLHGTVVAVHSAQRVFVVLGQGGRLVSLLAPSAAIMRQVEVRSRVMVQAQVWQNIGTATAVQVVPAAVAPSPLYPAVGQAPVQLVGVVVGMAADGALIVSPGPMSIHLTVQTKVTANVVAGAWVHVTAYAVGTTLYATSIETAAPYTTSPVPVPMAPVPVPQPGLTAPAPSTIAPVAGVSFSGRAYGASVAGTLVADTGQLAATGGNLVGFAGIVSLNGTGYSLVAPTVPGAAATARVAGQGSGVRSVGSTLNVRLTVGGVVITADTVQATAFAQCPIAPYGQTLVTGLVVNGVSQSLSGAANQTIALPGTAGTLTVNEQSVSGTTITVNALHIHTASGQDFIFGSAQAGIAGCAGVPGAAATPPPAAVPCVAAACVSSTVGGTAAGGIDSSVPLASTGSALACNTQGFAGVVNLAGPSYTVVAPTAPGAAGLARVVCSGTVVTSTGTMLNVTLTVAGVTIHADTALAVAVAQCGAAPFGQVLVAGLHVNGAPLPSLFNGSAANQSMALPGNVGTLTVNEQTVSGNTITVNAVHIHTTSGQDIILGTAQASVTPAQGATVCTTPTSPPPAAMATPVPPAAATSSAPTGTTGQGSAALVGYITVQSATNLTLSWAGQQFVVEVSPSTRGLLALPRGSLVAVHIDLVGRSLIASSGSLLAVRNLAGYPITVRGSVVARSSQSIVIVLGGYRFSFVVTPTTPGLSLATVGRLVTVQGVIAGSTFVASQIGT